MNALSNPAIIRLAAACAASLALAACGGGSDSPAPAPAGPAAVQIAATNQDAVARASASAVVGVSTLGTVSPLSAGPSSAATKGGAPSAALSFAGAGSVLSVLNQAQRYAVGESLRMTAIDPTVRAQAVTTQTSNCPAGGTSTLTVNDADNNGSASAGDSVAIAFSNCKPSAAETINGSLTIAISSIATNSLSGSLSFGALTTVDATGSYGINGSVALNFSVQGGVETYQMTVGGGGLTMTVTTPRYSDAVTLVAGFQQTQTYNPTALPPGGTVPGLGTASVNGSIIATSIGGTVTLQTVTPFSQYDIDPYPRSGQLRVTGANNSRLQLTALSTTLVRIELDANGDGTYEQVREVAWSSLL